MGNNSSRNQASASPSRIGAQLDILIKLVSTNNHSMCQAWSPSAVQIFEASMLPFCVQARNIRGSLTFRNALSSPLGSFNSWNFQAYPRFCVVMTLPFPSMQRTSFPLSLLLDRQNWSSPQFSRLHPYQPSLIQLDMPFMTSPQSLTVRVQPHLLFIMLPYFLFNFRGLYLFCSWFGFLADELNKLSVSEQAVGLTFSVGSGVQIVDGVDTIFEAGLEIWGVCGIYGVFFGICGVSGVCGVDVIVYQVGPIVDTVSWVLCIFGVAFIVDTD